MMKKVQAKIDFLAGQRLCLTGSSSNSQRWPPIEKIASLTSKANAWLVTRLLFEVAVSGAAATRRFKDALAPPYQPVQSPEAALCLTNRSSSSLYGLFCNLFMAAIALLAPFKAPATVVLAYMGSVRVATPCKQAARISQLGPGGYSSKPQTLFGEVEMSCFSRCVKSSNECALVCHRVMRHSSK